ncbi:MAG: hypothetical protein ACI3Z7_03320 [Candidatus Aphodosoma sp.]
MSAEPFARHGERDKAIRQLQEQKTGEQQRISMAVSRAKAEKENDKTIRLLRGALKSSRDILNIIADILQGKRDLLASHCLLLSK